MIIGKLQRLLDASGLEAEFCNDGSVILGYHGQTILHMNVRDKDAICMFLAGWNLARELK